MGYTNVVSDSELINLSDLLENVTEEKKNAKLIGIDWQLKRITDWLSSWEYAKFKTLMLHGRPGMGKTSSVYYVANKMGYKVIEFNLSDARTLEYLNKIYIAVRTRKPYKVIFLLDEVDGMAVTARGGRIPPENARVLLNIILSNRHPVVMTCNDINVLRNVRVKVQEKFRSITDFCEKVGFYKVTGNALVNAARMYGAKELDFTPTSFRQAKLAKFSTDLPSQDSRLDSIKGYFRYSILEQYDNAIGLALVENVVFNRLVDNWELYEFVKSLVVASRLNSPEPLNGISFSKENLGNVTSKILLFEKHREMTRAIRSKKSETKKIS